MQETILKNGRQYRSHPVIKSFLIGTDIWNQHPVIMTYDEPYKQGVTGLALPKKLTKQETCNG